MQRGPGYWVWQAGPAIPNGADNAPRGRMTTKLDKALKREIVVDDRPYTVTLTAEGVKVVEKGKRNGQELSWKAIVSGDAQLAESLKLSVDASSS